LQLSQDGTSYCPACVAVPEAPVKEKPSVLDYVRRFPATSAFLAVNILVYVAMCLGRVSPISPTVEQLIRWGADSGEKVLFHEQWWRILTSAFVHIGAAHLVMNMWALWLMGILAEAVLGTYLYASVYLLCAIAGSLASLYWNPLVIGAGASGALMGILGVLVSVLKFAHLPVPAEVVRSTTRSLIQGAVLTLAIGILPRIDNAAHVGGLLCGLLIGLLLSLTRRVDYALQRPLRQLCLLVPLLLMVPAAFAAKKKGEPWIHYEQGWQALRANHFPQAEQEARAALARLPENEDVQELLSTALIYQGNDAEAGKFLQQLVAHHPRNSFATNNLAIIDLREGNAAGARDLLLKALPQQPGNADGEVYLGQAFEALNDDQNAVAHYREALKINPNLYQAQMAMGSIYEKYRKPQDAILFYARAAQIRPRELEPLRALARVYLAAGMKPQADQLLAEIQKREQGGKAVGVRGTEKQLP
jgi:membrane associated rhomboid family serine protease/Flp pilus assembly protein TadD